VGIDFSDGSIRALEYALEQASALGASIACVHAYEDAPRTPAFYDPASALREQLAAVIAQHRKPKLRVRVDCIVRRGPPWEKLANVALDLGAEVIVVGADGERGASAGGFLGSVAARLVMKSTRSVVVVPRRPMRTSDPLLELFGVLATLDGRPLRKAPDPPRPVGPRRKGSVPANGRPSRSDRANAIPQPKAIKGRPRRGRRRGRAYRGLR
jgi:nucleotide-binding universal stress UspA family protein